MAGKSVVSSDLNVLIGLAGAAMNAKQPQIPINKSKYKAFFLFLKRCTPQNIFGLAKAHATALENMAALAQHLERLGCRCGGTQREGAHHDICPVRLRAHPVFQSFTATATDEAEEPAVQAIHGHRTVLPDGRTIDRDGSPVTGL